MEKVACIADPLFYKDDMFLNSSLRMFELPILIEEMKHEYSWKKGGLNTKILLRTPKKQILLAILQKGTEISSYQNDDSVTFQIVEGEITFQTRNESKTLDKGQLLTLYENIKYSLSTKTMTILLLTIAKSPLQPVNN